uniref:hypothetical protein n=1 Tax=Paenibacillus tengchongensis TaxID=2608684 RepID=UPI001651DA16
LEALSEYYLLKNQALRTNSGDDIRLLQNDDQLSIIVNGQWYRDIPVPSLEQLKQGGGLNNQTSYTFEFQEAGFVFVSENGNFIGLSRFETVEEDTLIETIDGIVNAKLIDIDYVLGEYSWGAKEAVEMISGALEGRSGMLGKLGTGLSVVGRVQDVIDKMVTAEDALKAYTDFKRGDLLTIDPFKDLQDFLSVGGLLPGKLSPLFMTMYLNGMFTIGSE